MNVLSLFDGISCGRVALERAGIPVSTYYASEIDKYAIQIAQKNYPDTIHIGDVKQIDFAKYKGLIDIIIGGSPCQDLSIAKRNRQGLHGEHSGLFWDYIKALSVIKPKYYLLENVSSMKATDRDTITDVLRAIYPETECIMINSALVSAQQRKRYYWTNWHVEQPQDKGIMMQDILEDGVTYQRKAYCITATYNQESFNDAIKKNKRSMICYPVPCAMRTRSDENGKSKRLEVKSDKKANSLTSVQTDSMVCYTGNNPKAYRIYTVRDKSVRFKSDDSTEYKIDMPDGDYTVRKLTPVECERLQTLPDNYTEGVSNTQRYKAIGNGWTVDVIAHILSAIHNAKVQ